MGGHAGGDVASAIAVQRIAEVDKLYASADEARVRAAVARCCAANALIAETVSTTPSSPAWARPSARSSGSATRSRIAHIGDSRIYLFRDGELTQITTDHTFVQRLVDSGRITPEEAAVHPRRSVLMRVLGDMDPTPRSTPSARHPRPATAGCSAPTASALRGRRRRSRRCLALGLAPGRRPTAWSRRASTAAPPTTSPSSSSTSAGSIRVARTCRRAIVGSASVPLAFEPDGTRRQLRLPRLLLHPLKSTPPEPSHFEPERAEYLEELIEEDRRRARRRRIGWLVVRGSSLLAAIVAAAVLGYSWTQTRYFVGADDDSVAIFQGVQQNIGPIALSHVRTRTPTSSSTTCRLHRRAVERTITADVARRRAAHRRPLDGRR